MNKTRVFDWNTHCFCDRHMEKGKYAVIGKYSAQGYEFRYSTVSDRQQITDLLLACFGQHAIDSGALEELNDRYLICFDGVKAVAMTGIQVDAIMRSACILWSCTLPQYRRRGLITAMLRYLLQHLHINGYTLESVCWQQESRQEPNMHKVMQRLGLQKLNYDIPFIRQGKQCTNCVFGKDTECRCRDVLYQGEVNERFI